MSIGPRFILEVTASARPRASLRNSLDRCRTSFAGAIVSRRGGRAGGGYRSTLHLATAAGVVHLVAALGAVLGCKSEVLFVPSERLEPALIVVALPARDGAPDFDRAELFFPTLGPISSPGLSLETGETLLLVPIEPAAFERAYSGKFYLDPSRTFLRAPSGFDCGPSGREVALGAAGLTQVRQALGRFEVGILELDADSNETRDASFTDHPALADRELEFPADPEACVGVPELELVPFDDRVIFERGVSVEGEALPAISFASFDGMLPTESERTFLFNQHAVFAVRAGQRFDETLDDVMRSAALGLPTGPEETWGYLRYTEVPAQVETVRRLMLLLLRRNSGLRDDNAWAVVDVSFDGANFLPPIVRALEQDSSAAVFIRDAEEAVLVAGTQGRWARSTAPYEEFEMGSGQRGDITAVLATGSSQPRHLIGFRRGYVVAGDLLSATGMEAVRLRTTSHVARFAQQDLGGSTRYFSGWDDGEVHEVELGVGGPVLGPSALSLPRRLVDSTCAEAQPDECGRTHAAEGITSLIVREREADRDLLIAGINSCQGLVVHDLKTNCTTGIEFPNQNPTLRNPPILNLVGGRYFVNDRDGKLFEFVMK